MISGDESVFSDVIRFLGKRKDVISCGKISMDKENMYLRVLTKNIKSIHNFSHVFFENNCFPVAPVKLEKGFEKWILGTAHRDSIRRVHSILKKSHKVRMKYVKEDTIRTKLTNKQREILTYAQHFGYYQLPRKNSVTDICRILKIPKTVFLSHLRKAEIKIINDFLGSP